MIKMENKKDQELDNGLKLLVKSSLFVLIALILAKIFGYLYRIIIARYFGPEIYGLFSLSIVIMGWFVTFSLLGFDGGILRYISFYRGKNELNKIKYLFQSSSKILLFLSLVMSAISFFLSSFISISIFHNPNLIPFLKIFSITIPFWTLSLYFLSTIRAFEKIKEVSLIDNIIQSFLKLVLLILFIFIGLKINAIIFSFSLSILITFLLAYLYCKFKISKIFLKYNLNKINKKKVLKNFSYYGISVESVQNIKISKMDIQGIGLNNLDIRLLSPIGIFIKKSSLIKINCCLKNSI